MDGSCNSSAPSNGCPEPPKKQASSAAEVSRHSSTQLATSNDLEADNASSFGSRLLSAEKNVFEHNAWDHVEPDSEYLEYAEQQIRMHHENPVPAEQREIYNTTPAEFWNSFYSINQNRFFKDRHWLRVEFPELFNWTTDRNQSKFNIMEVGCGAGNAVFPILADIADPRLFVYACDYSQVAIDVVKASEAYDQQRCTAFVWDLAGTELPTDVQPESIDIMLMIFVFSALHPKQWNQAVDNAYRLLKPGGILLFRDYGRNDLAQVRFKKSRLLEDNLYIRGDGTRVYFFTNDELAEIFGAKFEIEQNAIDRRLLVNRKRELKMYRVWLQAKFRKSNNA
ncbi:S-adenosyl-L-methionine-dependent methyltransferase [Coemansia mojavensis]|nr:S-adenosyl-L-methionine-dependent methyltransferase [Coemansia mojavensis]